MVESLGHAKELIERLLSLDHGGRYLAAHEIYSKLEAALNSGDSASRIDEETKCYLSDQFKTHEKLLARLQERHREIVETLHYQDDNQKWVVGATMFGITTSYQYDQSDHSLIIKMEGVMEDLPLFEQCCVIHEVDLFTTWLPFCKQGVTVDKIGMAELIPYIYIYLPPLGRDFIMQAYGADCLHENGKLLIIGKSIDDYPDKPVPFREKGWFQDRMTVRQFKAITEVLSPTSAKTIIVADVDPNCPLPQALLNLVIQKLAGVVLYFFQKQVIKVSKNPHCEHANRIRQNKEFYMHWLLPKLREYCDLRGWEQPVIASLGEDGLPPAKQQETREGEATKA